MDIPGVNDLHIGWRDVTDIALVTLLFYHAIAMIRQTRAVAAVYGLLLIAAAQLLARFLSLNTLNWLLEEILGSVFLLVVIVFQRDIRQALSSLGAGRLRLRGFFRRKADDPLADMTAAAAAYMAQRKIGALIVLERNVPLGDAAERGVRLDALPSVELLTTVFWPNSPLHDGALIISRGRIMAAGCILPLSTAIAKRDYGTRHRAALGITEESDAVVVVVSEERGVMAVAVDGRITASLDETKLKRVLQSALAKKL
ncbi:MAG: diadenylate cyclase CdaA [Desulfovibrio sp.]|jgi:uncharacterized protein (TIGR00159 family)|nr:diadenylate cyclase CdaA [Desulfovibrio sp.]